MRVIRWKNSATGVESLNITAPGIYFPVGKEDGAFVARYVMAAGGQTASIEDVRSPAGDRVGNPSISVSGTTEVIARNRRSLAYGIAVTAISGTLTATLDDLVVRTNWPDNLGRFTAKEDADAYTYGGTGLDGCGATIAGVHSVYNGPGVGWVAQGGLGLNKNSLLVFGDSIAAICFTAIDGDTLPGRASDHARFGGDFGWMQMRLGDKAFSKIINRATPGLAVRQCVPGSPQYDPQYDFEKLISGADSYEVYIGIGTNDIQNDPPDLIVSNILWCANYAKSQGRRVHISTILPRDANYGPTYDTTARQLLALQVNAKIAAACASNGHHLVDRASVFLKKSDNANWTSDGVWGSWGNVYDGVHPSNIGFYGLGKVMHEHFDKFRSPSVLQARVASHPLASVTAGSSQPNLVPNSMLTNGMSGFSFATSQANIQSITNTLVPSPDGVGNAIQFDIVATGPSFTQLFYNLLPDTGGAFSARGNNLVAMAKFKIEGPGGVGNPTGTLGPGFGIGTSYSGNPSGGAADGVFIPGTSTSTTEKSSDESMIVQMKTPPVRTTGVVANIQPRIDAYLKFISAGSCRVTVWDIAVFKNQSPYGANLAFSN